MVALLCGKKGNFFCGKITSLGRDGVISQRKQSFISTLVRLLHGEGTFVFILVALLFGKREVFFFLQW